MLKKTEHTPEEMASELFVYFRSIHTKWLKYGSDTQQAAKEASIASVELVMANTDDEHDYFYWKQVKQILCSK